MRSTLFWCLMAAGLAFLAAFAQWTKAGTLPPLKALQLLGVTLFFVFHVIAKWGGYRGDRRQTLHQISRAGGWLIIVSVLGYAVEWCIAG